MSKTPRAKRPTLRTYVVDTSVLLSDPRAMERFDEHEVVLPVVVLTELESKRNHPELGWAARRALRTLEELRLEHGTLVQPLPINDHGGTLRVELNHQDSSGLPAALQGSDGDGRILAVARNLANEGRHVTVVTKDLPLRLKASIVGLEADEYRNELATDTSWTGMVELDVARTDINALFSDKVIDLDEARDLPVNTGLALSSGSQSALARVRDDKRVHLVRGDRALFDVHGRSAEQRIAIDILAVARNLSLEGHDVTLVSKDLPLRLKASIVGLEADEYRNELATDTSWTGMVELDVARTDINALFSDKVIDLDEARDLPVNTGLALTSGSQSALARVRDDKRVHLVRGDRSLFEVHGRSAEQRIAIDILADPSVEIVSLGGAAGTGKSVLALAAGLDAVLEQRSHKRVVVFRPLFAVGGQELGYLPGSESEKMSPWGAAVIDALEAIAGPHVIDAVLNQGLLEILPLTHIRGRSLTDSFVIIDEAQNLERMVLLTALSRLGTGSRVVLTHDVAQRDNLRVGRHDGVVSVIEALRGHPIFGHVTFTRSERSAVAALVTALLD